MNPQEEGERIEGLLEEIGGTADPRTWARVEELVQRLLAMQGTGLERVLACAQAAGASPERLGEKLREDPLVESLLVLHGLHPLPLADRIEQALDEVRPYLGSHAGGVELLGVEEGVVRLKMIGTCVGCPSSRVTIDHAIRRAVEEAAPEVTRIEVEAT